MDEKSEAGHNGKADMSFQSDWDMKNVSSKSIVAVVETMLIQYSNGSSDAVTGEYDAFFHPQVLKPGDSYPMGGTSAGKKVVEDRQSSIHSEQVCEVSVQWIQFEDGDTVGDVRQAAHLLATRKQILAALTHLDDVYRSQGTQAFMNELLKPIPDPHADGYLEHLRRFQAQHGSVETYQRLQMHLQMAQERRQIVGGQQTPPD